MSPSWDASFLRLGSFPRVSGDEPTPKPHEEPDVAFSPRERG